MTIAGRVGTWLLVALLAALCAIHIYNIHDGQYVEFMGLQHLTGEVDAHGHPTHADENGTEWQEGSALEGRNNEWSYLIPMGNVRDANVCAYDRNAPNMGNTWQAAGRAYDRQTGTYNTVKDGFVDLYRNCRFPDNLRNREWHQTGVYKVRQDRFVWFDRKSDHDSSRIGTDGVEEEPENYGDERDFEEHQHAPVLTEPEE